MIFRKYWYFGYYFPVLRQKDTSVLFYICTPTGLLIFSPAGAGAGPAGAGAADAAHAADGRPHAADAADAAGGFHAHDAVDAVDAYVYSNSKLERIFSNV